MEVETNFLAEEWLELLQKEVKPAFSAIDFVSYIPPSPETQPWKKMSPRVLVIIPEKSLFIYNLKGVAVTKRAVINSLKRYVFQITQKHMTEK
jgi:hypothetical protein